jgi:hypothetical protein
MWHFYWRSIRRIPSLAVEAVKRVDTFVGLLTICVWVFIGGTAAGAWWEQVPWQVPVTAIIVFLVYGFLRAVYQEYWQVEQERDDAKREGNKLEQRLEDKAKRKAVNELLGNALEEGLSLKQGRKYTLASGNENPEGIEMGNEYQARYDEEVRTWVDRTYNLINDAFGKAEAERFISNEGYTDEELFGRELPPFVHLNATQRKYLIPARLRRLDKVIDRANSLEINSDFEPQSTAQETRESAAARLRLLAAVEQRNEENESLKADREQLTVQRDAFEQESRELRADRDGQVSERCSELSRELDRFLKERKQQDHDETMRQYDERFKRRVAHVRHHLERLEWWNPGEDVRARLENPETPDDLWILAEYLAAVSAESHQ